MFNKKLRLEFCNRDLIHCFQPLYRSIQNPLELYMFVNEQEITPYIRIRTSFHKMARTCILVVEFTMRYIPIH